MAETDTTRSPTSRVDLAGYFESCSETFEQLASIAYAIQDQSKRDRFCITTIKNLAGGARRLAEDMASISDSWREEVTTHGVRNE